MYFNSEEPPSGSVNKPLLLLLLLLLLFCFVFFNHPISSSICKLPIRSESYNFTFKNTNKVLRNLSLSLFSFLTAKMQGWWQCSTFSDSIWRYLVQKQNFTTIYTTSKPQVFDQELLAIVSVKMLCDAAVENLI